MCPFAPAARRVRRGYIHCRTDWKLEVRGWRIEVADFLRVSLPLRLRLRNSVWVEFVSIRNDLRRLFCVG